MTCTQDRTPHTSAYTITHINAYCNAYISTRPGIYPNIHTRCLTHMYILHSPHICTPKVCLQHYTPVFIHNLAHKYTHGIFSHMYMSACKYRSTCTHKSTVSQTYTDIHKVYLHPCIKSHVHSRMPPFIPSSHTNTHLYAYNEGTHGHSCIAPLNTDSCHTGVHLLIYMYSYPIFTPHGPDTSSALPT